ncbi:TonB-dependent receptor [Bacteroides heparinolyticus]|uniref:TonB-dependent receptor n=1 Tax=Prevotella heparinolytica TaxID=28113 RepID=UPI000D03F270|nr:TonB-dependent receptor [Bacteroides heparinolyticus]AVM58133.1 TonB-dependent receptor [Bacteroides heparinolyticus]
MKPIICFVGLCLSCLIGLCAQTVSVSGYVRDAASGEALQGANVYSPSGHYGKTTDEKGFFRFRMPQGKPVELTFSFVGYTPQTHCLALVGDTVLAVALLQNNRLPDVRIYAPRRDFGVKNSQMSAVELPVAQVRSMPALFGETDVMKALQRLPGVQSAGDGNAGIYVRGGDYDQNLITLDGSTLYNSEHLKGFVSALNTDMIENIIFYKGAFPARYGARLSSVVDIGIKDGDMSRYHGALSVGMLASKIHIEGPVRRGTTSLNVAARASYFDAIVQPLLRKVYDKPEVMRPYAQMNYYDINAKLVHRFSGHDKLSAVFYKGRDVNDAAPTDSKQKYRRQEYEYSNEKMNSTENSWGNMVSSLFWTHAVNDRLSVNTNLSYSRYNYRLQMRSKIYNETYNNSVPEAKPWKLYKEDSYARYHSGIDDAALTIDFHCLPQARHSVRWGAKAALQRFTPIVDVYKNVYTKEWDLGKYREFTQLVDTVLGERQRLKTFALYAEDDFELAERWKVNAGLRYTLFAVKGKTYHSLEPRLSARFLLTDDMALKFSYSRMTQGIHLLSSSNLVMPSDIWVPVTGDIAPMQADQWALGYNYTTGKGIDLSIEAYYKRMDNVIDYREGVSYMTSSADWQKMVAMGKARSYGVELFVQKKAGSTTGWIGYTWAKSLRTYDRPGQEIASGEEFYAGNDRRNNFNAVLTQRLGSHWEVSAAWTYQTGRRGTLTTTALYSGMPDEYDPYGEPFASDTYMHGDGEASSPAGGAYFRKFLRFYSYAERNGYRMPAVHRLDISVNFSIKHRQAESILGLSIYNLYNRQNISNVYIGYERNETVLKGICMFPFMPSLNYTLKF